MKSYTDIEQSKKLAEILPTESADMAWYLSYTKDGYSIRMLNDTYPLDIVVDEYDEIPAWSLAALLDILSNKAYSINEDANVSLSSYKTIEWDLGVYNSDLELITESDPIDACVEMIYRLKEKDLL